MTGVDVDALDAARAAATAGEWTAEPNYRLEKGCRCLSCWEPIPGSWDINPLDGPDCEDDGCFKPIRLSEADAAYIVAMHAALPDLLAEVRRGRALREAVEGLAEELAESDREGDNGGWGDGAAAAERGIADRLRAALTTTDGTP